MQKYTNRMLFRWFLVILCVPMIFIKVKVCVYPALKYIKARFSACHMLVVTARETGPYILETHALSHVFRPRGVKVSWRLAKIAGYWHIHRQLLCQDFPKIKTSVIKTSLKIPKSNQIIVLSVFRNGLLSRDQNVSGWHWIINRFCGVSVCCHCCLCSLGGSSMSLLCVAGYFFFFNRLLFCSLTPLQALIIWMKFSALMPHLWPTRHWSLLHAVSKEHEFCVLWVWLPVYWTIQTRKNPPNQNWPMIFDQPMWLLIFLSE